MDLKSYMATVQNYLDSMTEQQMRDWILSQARTVEKERRQTFLENLTGTQKVVFSLTTEEISQWCRQIEEGKLYLQTQQEEYYEEGEWDSDWRTVYYDRAGILPYLHKALENSCKMVAAREYKKAGCLLDRLCRLEIHHEPEEEYWEDDCEPMTLERLSEEELLDIDFDELSLNLIYAVYQSTQGEERIQKLYEYLSWSICGGITMTDVFAFGPEELPDMEGFMQQWHDYLQGIPGDRAAELLTDACVYIGGEERLLNTARETVKLHPYLYKACCQKALEEENWDGCISVGLEAVRKISVNKVIRGQIAEISFQAAKQLQDETMKLEFSKAAFFSEPDCVRLLRLYQFHDTCLLTDSIKRLDEIPEKPFLRYAEDSYKEQQETSINEKNLKDVYRFMLGDFEWGWKNGSEGKASYLG